MSRKGPIESAPWPDALSAHAIDGVRVHGYDVEADLARDARFTDVVFLALTGELPDGKQSRAFEVALMWALPVTAREAAVHAAILAALCDARPSGVVATASSIFAEDAMRLFSVTTDVIARGSLPADLRASTPEEARSVEALAHALDGLVAVPLLAERPRRDVAIVLALRACGLETPLQIAGALALARLPSAIAEAAPRKPGDFASYPTTTPPIVYED